MFANRYSYVPTAVIAVISLAMVLANDAPEPVDEMSIIRTNINLLAARQEILETRQASLEKRQVALETRREVLEKRQAARETRQTGLETRQAALEARQDKVFATQQVLLQYARTPQGVIGKSTIPLSESNLNGTPCGCSQYENGDIYGCLQDAAIKQSCLDEKTLEDCEKMASKQKQCDTLAI